MRLRRIISLGALSFALCRGSHHVHDDERRHIAAFGRFQELFCLLKHRFQSVAPLALPRCCRIPRIACGTGRP